MKALILGAACCVLTAQAPPLTLAELEARLRPSPEALRTESALAEQSQNLNATRGFLREGATLNLEAGPRKATGVPGTTDRSMGLDMPLFLKPSLHREAARAVGSASPLMKAAARVESRYRFRLAYLDAWLEAEVARLRIEDMVTLETWFKVVQARVDAGADPAFQASLVEGEGLRSLQERDEATHRAMAAWGRLRVLVDLPAAPASLAGPGLPVLQDPKILEARFPASILCKVLVARRKLDQSRLRLDEAVALSRWSLRGSHGREGEEQVTRIGFAVRLPRSGETRDAAQTREAKTKVLEQEHSAESMELDARMRCALERLEAAGRLAMPTDVNLLSAMKAVELRLLEGRDKPSEALPIRRQLLEARIALARRIHALHILNAELEALTAGVTP